MGRKKKEKEEEKNKPTEFKIKNEECDEFLSHIEEIRDLARKNLYYFTKYVLNFDKLTKSLHLPLCEFIQNPQFNRKLILLPRAHLKSTICTISYPIWLIIQKKIEGLDIKGTDVRILIANESATNAEHFLAAIQNILETNRELQTLFPNIVPAPNKRKRWNQQELVVNRTVSFPEATIQTIGVGGAIQSNHFDVIILDDLIGKEAMDSETVMEKTRIWLDYTESLLVNPKKSMVIIIGTRWHRRDIYQHVIDNDPRFVVYSRQAVEDGKVIFPEQFDMEFYDALRNKNPMLYYSQYLNNPVDPERCDFRPEWLKTYEWVQQDNTWAIKFEDDPIAVPLSSFDIVGAFDPSVDENSKTSRMAVVFAGMDYKQRVVILDVFAARQTIDTVIDRIFSMYQKWRPRILGIESVVFSRLYVYIFEKEMRKRMQWLNIVPIKVSSIRSKESRIRDALQAVAAQGRLYRSAGMGEFDQEFMEFPQGRYRDILDAATHAVNMLRQPESVENIKEYDELEEEFLRGRNPVTGY